MTTLLEVSELRKTFRARGKASTIAVAGVSFSVSAGQTLALVGESGAGKSTVGRLVLRLLQPDSGSVVFEGIPVLEIDRRELREARRRMQMIFQDPYGSLDPRMPIGEAVAEPLRVHFKTQRAERLEHAAELLERVGISTKLFNRYPSELSGGQLQRIAIARALTLRPAFIVCDEPVAALDVSVRAQVINLMRELQEELDLAYLFITHDMALVEVIADSVAIMRRGRIVEAGTTAQVFEAPETPYTKELLGSVPRLVPKAVARLNPDTELTTTENM